MRRIFCKTKMKNVCVVVLGDIGRSPRMQYHSLSLAENGHTVDIVGYGETRPLEALISQPLVSLHYLNSYPNIPLPKFLNYICKTIWQALTLMFVLLIIRRADIVLVQNPPAVPCLIICWIYKIIAGAKLIVDWHNYANTIMALNVGSEHVLVKLTKKLESFVGRRADCNFCVTNAMKNDLLRNWDISAVTLYDKPPEIFHKITPEEKHEVLNRLAVKYKELQLSEGEGSLLTKADGDNSVVLQEHRPGLLISSTSWTEDEDFSVLLAALQDYENAYKNGNPKKLSKLICIITGKGPLKNYYISKINELNWESIRIITPWLESEDYPLFLACCDLGVSLHTSSSGLDLPMKVVDMFGCCLPVCAYNFRCLNELVRHQENSYIFNTSAELSEQIQNWFENFPNNTKQQHIVKKFKTELEKFQEIRWKENWTKIASSEFVK